MQQIVDLQNSAAFQATGSQLISISTDPVAQQAPEANALDITVPMLVDDGTVTEMYGADEFALESGEPSHTFYLVDSNGDLVWMKDYGAPDNPERTMYVEVDQLIGHIERELR